MDSTKRAPAAFCVFNGGRGGTGEIWLKALKYAPTTFRMHRKGEELRPQIQALEERTLQSSVLRHRMQLPSLLLKFLIFWLFLARSWEAPCSNRLWKYSDMRQIDPTAVLLFLPFLTADDLLWRKRRVAWRHQKAHWAWNLPILLTSTLYLHLH